MREHTIRLRGGWGLEHPSAGSRRVELPLREPLGLKGRARFTRWFQRPPIDPDRERLGLLIQDVPGLLSVRLDDRNLWDGGEIGLAPIPLHAPLPSRIRLAFEVDLDRAFIGEAGPWGTVALVISGVEDGTGESR